MPRVARTLAARQSPPLGSLTQLGTGRLPGCRACGSDRVTRLSMRLTDGTPVDFTSCQACEHRTWAAPTGEVLPTADVLERTRKPARPAG
jgi:hypothetical protein